MLQKRFSFDDIFADLTGVGGPYDVREDDKKFEIEVDLPGVDPAEIDVTAAHGELSIKAERKWSRNSDKPMFYRSFSKIFSIPSVDYNDISATYSNGVLKITIPKSPKTIPKKIEIKVL